MAGSKSEKSGQDIIQQLSLVFVVLGTISGIFALYGLGPRIITIDFNKEPYVVAPTGQATSASFDVSVMVLGLDSLVFTIDLAPDFTTTMLNWGDYFADNYSIYATDNLSKGFVDPPIAAGLTSHSYNDTDAGLYNERYYQLRQSSRGVETRNIIIVGKFNLLVEPATLTPGEVERNSLSIPLMLDDSLLDVVIYNASTGDVIATYNTTASPPGYDAVMRFVFGWAGDYDSVIEGRGYDFTIVAQKKNLTVVGRVPTGNFTKEIITATLTPGQVEKNSVGWYSAYPNCDINGTLFSLTANGDVISTYDRYSSPPSYKSVRKFPFGWAGDFGCFEPGKGYSFTIVASPYNFTYNRG